MLAHMPVDAAEDETPINRLYIAEEAYNAPYVPLITCVYDVHRPTYHIWCTDQGLNLGIPNSYLDLAVQAVSWHAMPELIAYVPEASVIGVHANRLDLDRALTKLAASEQLVDALQMRVQGAPVNVSQAASEQCLLRRRLLPPRHPGLPCLQVLCHRILRFFLSLPPRQYLYWPKMHLWCPCRASEPLKAV